jgi:hypothetical protein
LHQLQASLGLKDDSEGTYEDITNALKAQGFDEKKDKHTWDVVKEACVCCVDVSRKFCRYPAGRTWSMGTEYNIAWMLLHHAEEAMIEAADFDTLIREAKHDFMAIQGSHALLPPLARRRTWLSRVFRIKLTSTRLSCKVARRWNRQNE